MITKRIAGMTLGLALVAGFAVPASAQTVAELQAQIQALMAQLAALQTGSTATVAVTFTQDLTVGSTGPQVVALQQMLVAQGHLTMPAGVAYGYFGTLTQQAVAKWQAANGIAPAAGYFGPISRAKANAAGGITTGGTTTTGGSTTTGGLQGGVGEIGDADFISTLNNEEVGEDAEVEVAGLDIEADGSDIELRAVTLDFSKASANAGDDFHDYASEVSIMLDGKVVATVDAEDFEDDDDYSETVALASGSIIREGDTAELVVSVTALDNLDADQLADTWTLEFESIRFVDAQSAVVTDSSTGDINGVTRTFSFESFSTAADVDLHITEGDDTINDAQTIIVDDESSTEGVEVLAFNAEVEGDSDLMVEDIAVTFTVGGGASSIEDMITDVTLYMDGDEIGSETVGTAELITFDDLELDLEAGEEYEFVVAVDFLSTDDGIANGDTISATVTVGSWDVEDEAGESETPSGAATSDTHTVYEDGISVNVVSTDADANDDDTVGTFTIVVDVTAFGDDQYVHQLASNASSTDAGFYYTVARGGTAVNDATATSTLVSSSATEDGEYFVIEEGETERFTLTVTVDAVTGGLHTVELDSLRFDPDNAADSASTEDTWFNIPSSEDAETPALQVDAS